MVVTKEMSTLFSYFNRVEAPSQCSKSSPGNDAVSNSKTPAPAKSGVKKVCWRALHTSGCIISKETGKLQLR